MKKLLAIYFSYSVLTKFQKIKERSEKLHTFPEFLNFKHYFTTFKNISFDCFTLKSTKNHLFLKFHTVAFTKNTPEQLHLSRAQVSLIKKCAFDDANSLHLSSTASSNFFSLRKKFKRVSRSSMKTDFSAILVMNPE